MKVRPYQERAINDLRAAYAAGSRAPCLVLPTGGGKTVVAAAIISAAVALGRRVLFLAHREELISQSVAKLEASGVTSIRVIQASRDLGSPTAPVAVASIPTLTRWATSRIPRADLVIFDEAHHTVAETWAQIAGWYAHAHLLGLTATPQRGDGRALGDVFDALVIGSTVKELTELGHLVPCRIWAPPRVLESATIATSPVDAYAEHAQDERAVVFCRDLEHAERVALEFNAAGIPAASIHGKLSAGERARRLAALRSGELRVVTNVHVLTEGWDQPEVSTCILARKPQTTGTFLQMVGRVLRPAPGKLQAKVLDLCGASLEHGPPELERTYTLDGEGITKADREPIRQCPTCGAVFVPAGPVCPSCGMELPRREQKAIVSAGVGLVEARASVDQLLLNLQAAARRGKRSEEWVARAYQAITRRVA